MDNSGTNSLMPLRFGFFMLYGCIGILSVFYPLYLKEYGLQPAEIGIALFFLPLGGVLAGVFSPLMIRRFGGQMNVMCSCMAFLLLSSLCMVFVPLPDISAVCVEATTKNSTQTSTNSTASNRVFKVVHEGSEIEHFVHIVGFCLVAFCVQFASSACDGLQISVALQFLGEANSGGIGNYRAWGSLGHAFGAIATGALVSTSRVSRRICGRLIHLADYHSMYYLSAVFATVTLGNLPTIFKSGRATVQTVVIEQTTSCRKILTTFKNLSWLFILLCNSVFLPIAQGFLNWHLENIGASPFVIGASTFITTTVEFFMFFITPMLIRQIGHWKLVSAGMATFVARFLAYAALVDPMYVLLIQVVDGVTFASQWSAIVSHLSSQVPEDCQAEVQGIIQALTALGMGISFPVSGVLTQAFGAPRMFQICALMALIFLVMFVTSQLIPKKWFQGKSSC